MGNRCDHQDFGRKGGCSTSICILSERLEFQSRLASNPYYFISHSESILNPTSHSSCIQEQERHSRTKLQLFNSCCNGTVNFPPDHVSNKCDFS